MNALIKKKKTKKLTEEVIKEIYKLSVETRGDINGFEAGAFIIPGAFGMSPSCFLYIQSKHDYENSPDESHSQKNKASFS